jgi:CarD family transcriptional regulator
LSTASRSAAARAFRVGDDVVYAAHGVGRIAGREQRDIGGAARECFVVDLVSGLRVTLPLEDAADRLRAVAEDAEIEQVAAILAAPPRQRDAGWAKRLQADKAKLATGNTTELAELVRDGAQIEASGSGSRLSHSERRLYLQARELLAREIAWVRALEVQQVEVWIDAQIKKSPGSEA